MACTVTVLITARPSSGRSLCLDTLVALFRCRVAMADASLMGSRAPEEESRSDVLVPANDASAPPSNEVAVLGAVLSQLQAEFCCAICQGLVVAPHMLPCSHRFCGACIFKWTPRHNTCPTCRTIIREPLALERGVVRGLRRSVTLSLERPNPRATHRTS